jgi:hypothetical protein
MISTYQENVIEYFSYHVNDFVKFLTSDTGIVIVADFRQYVLMFIDQELKKEIGIYLEGSAGYHRVLDMIIEINIQHKTNEFFEQLCERANKAFKQLDTV